MCYCTSHEVCSGSINPMGMTMHCWSRVQEADCALGRGLAGPMKEAVCAVLVVWLGRGHFGWCPMKEATQVVKLCLAEVMKLPRKGAIVCVNELYCWLRQLEFAHDRTINCCKKKKKKKRKKKKEE